MKKSERVSGRRDSGRVEATWASRLSLLSMSMSVSVSVTDQFLTRDSWGKDKAATRLRFEFR